jgi:hypothetical protein
MHARRGSKFTIDIPPDDDDVDGGGGGVDRDASRAFDGTASRSREDVCVSSRVASVCKSVCVSRASVYCVRTCATDA